MGLNVHIVSRKSNKVKALVEIEEVDEAVFQREEIIIGNIRLYFKVEILENLIDLDDEKTLHLFVHLENLSKKKNDKMIYSCNLSSKELRMRKQRFICDDTEWRLLLKENSSLSSNIKFDLTVELVKIETRNPLATMYSDTELTDFKLCAANGSVAFHSVALAGASPVLKQMLLGQWQETKSRKLVLQDTALQTLQQLKEYLYLNIVPNNKSDIENLLILASYYLMSDLQKVCEEALEGLVVVG